MDDDGVAGLSDLDPGTYAGHGAHDFGNQPIICSARGLKRTQPYPASSSIDAASPVSTQIATLRPPQPLHPVPEQRQLRGAAAAARELPNSGHDPLHRLRIWGLNTGFMIMAMYLEAESSDSNNMCQFVFFFFLLTP
jgi:hypothetical protein